MVNYIYDGNLSFLNWGFNPKNVLIVPTLTIYKFYYKP